MSLNIANNSSQPRVNRGGSYEESALATTPYDPQTISQDTRTAIRSPNEQLFLPTARNGSASLVAEIEKGPVNAMGATSFTEDHISVSSSAFYGGSSAAYFMNQVREQIPGPKSPVDIQHASPSTDSGLGWSQNTTAQSLLRSTEDVVLPTRHLADQLIDVYWQESHTLYPFLHRPSMERAYSNLWESSSARRETGSIDLGLGSTPSCDERTRVFQCALNAIFALSCQ